MTTRQAFGSALGLATLAGCLHLPPSRPVREGEVVELGAVSVRLPDEPGWKVRHIQVRQDQMLTLFHTTPSGEVDRRALVAQSAGTPDFATFLDLRDGSGALVVKPAGSGGALPPGASRYGPLSARFDYRVEPATAPGGAPGGGHAGSYSTWIFAPPERLDRSYRVTFYERDSAQGTPDGGHQGGRAARAEAFFDAVQLRQPSSGTWSSTPPQVAFQPALGLTVGGTVFRLMGESLAGVDERFWGGLDRLEPGAGRGAGWDLGFRALAGQRSGLAAAVVLLSPSVFLAWGPVRLRAGVDLGYATLEDRATLVRRQGVVAGGSLGAAVDVHRGEKLDWLVEAEVSAGAQRFQAAGLRLGVRFH